MSFVKIIALSTIVFFTFFRAQAQIKPPIAAPSKVSNAAKLTPAYAEVLLRKTERESELEELLIDHTDEFPKVKETKFELILLNREIERMLAVNASETGKLTLALGKLIVRKTELETDVWTLQRQYSDDHPEVKRAKRKVEVFEKAVKEILP